MPLSKVKKNTLTVLLSIEMLTAYTVSLFSLSGIIETIFNKFVKKFSIWGDNSNIHVVQIHWGHKIFSRTNRPISNKFWASMYTSSLAKGFAHGFLSLHPCTKWFRVLITSNSWIYFCASASVIGGSKLQNRLGMGDSIGYINKDFPLYR